MAKASVKPKTKTPPKTVTKTVKAPPTKKAAPQVSPAANDEERRWAFKPTRDLTPTEITDLFFLLNLTVKGKKAYDKLDKDIAPLFVEIK